MPWCVCVALLAAIVFSGAARAQAVSLAVTNIPATATRVVAVLDGRTLAQSISFSQDFAAGTSAAVLNTSAPAGGPYRIRAVAVTPDILPAVVRSGQTNGILVPASASVGAAISLADISATADPLTPVSASAASTITIGVDFTDPGDFLDGIGLARFWTATTPFSNNMRAAALDGAITKLGNGMYQAMASVTLPAAGTAFYYQFGESVAAFTTPDGLGASYLIWPNLQLGGALQQIAITPGATLDLTVSGIPPAASSVVAVVDGGMIIGTASASENFTPGTVSVEMNIGVPGGGPYRVRAVALASGIAPAVLSSGLVSGLSVASGSLPASIALTTVTAALDASTPTTAGPGSTATVRVNFADPGEFLDGVHYSQFWTSATPFTSDLRGTSVTGGLTSLGAGNYQAAVNLTMPASGSGLYYQFGQSVAAFTAPDSQASYLIWPTVESGSPGGLIILGGSTGINLTVYNIPAAASSLVAAVDGGGIAGTSTASQYFAPGTSSVTLSVGTPPGGPYRVRAVALLNGTIPAVLSSGETVNITAASGLMTDAAISLGALTASLDPSTPASAPAGAAVAIRVNLIDPGDFLGGTGTAQFWTAASPFLNDLGGAAAAGTITNSGPGSYQASATVTLPSSGTALYFQLGQVVAGFNTPDGLNASYLVWPILEAGGSLEQIGIQTVDDCTYSVYPTAQSASPVGGGAAFYVGSPNGCNWSATSNAPWLIVPDTGIGTGVATELFPVAANAGTTLTGTVSIAGVTGTVVQTGAQTPPAEAFVTHLYLDVLGRPPDPDGLSYYAGLIESGAMSDSQVAAGMYASGEFVNLWQLVASCYTTILARDADYQGWLFYTAMLVQGSMTTNQLIDSFLDSSELAISQGPITNSDLVTILYQNALGRSPDPGGFNFYVNALDTGTLTQDQVVMAFIDSPEFLIVNGDRLSVSLLYFTLLRRDVDPGGLAYYVGLLDAGTPLSNVINTFITSPEYLLRYSSATL